MSKKRISDEKILTALFENPTITTAARSAGCSERTIYSRLQDECFLEEYRQRQDSTLEITINNLSGKAADAIRVLSDIMENTEYSATVRRAAAVDILTIYDKLTSRLYERRKASGEEIDIEDSDAYFAAAEWNGGDCDE